jgi:MerR family mercuric resistance operon transcriptional regulator
MEDAMDLLTVGQLARQAGVHIETVRYYERRGLIPEPPRRASGYRQYTREDVHRLQFIKRAQELGFSLKDIAELLSLRVDPETTCGDVKARAAAKLADIDDKIRSLRAMKTALTRLAAACTGEGPTSACPILEFLEAERGDPSYE